MNKSLGIRSRMLWRFVRVFLAGFIGAFSIETFIGADRDLKLSILQAAITGAIAALFKALRDTNPDNEIVGKVPL